MFSHIKEFFLGDASIAIDSSGEPTCKDLQTACWILLMEMAAADNEIAREEVEAISSSLQKQFDISDQDINELVDIGSVLRLNSDKVGKFVALINENFAEEQRRLILAMIWKVVIADGNVDEYEVQFASNLVSRLGLTEKDAERARTMAEKGDV